MRACVVFSLALQALRSLQAGALLQPGLPGNTATRPNLWPRSPNRRHVQKDDWNDHRDDCNKDKGLPFSNPQSKEQIKARSTGIIEDGVYLDRLTEQVRC